MNLDYLVAFLSKAGKLIQQKMNIRDTLPNPSDLLTLKHKEVGLISTSLIPFPGSSENWMGLTLESHLEAYKKYTSRILDDEISPPGWKKQGINLISEGINVIFAAKENNAARITYSQKEDFTIETYSFHLSRMISKMIDLFNYGRRLAMEEDPAPEAEIVESSFNPPKKDGPYYGDDIKKIIDTGEINTVYKHRLPVNISNYLGSIVINDRIKGQKILLTIEEIKKVADIKKIVEELDNENYDAKYTALDALIIKRDIDYKANARDVKEMMDYASKLVQKIDSL